MQSRNRTEAEDLGGLMTERRGQIPFRVGMAALTVLLFLLEYGDARVVLWAATYIALQVAEAFLFPKDKIASLCSNQSHTFLALLILAANTAVFPGVLFVELPKLGLWFTAYGQVIVGATMLNTALTTHGCRKAFLASIAPCVIYLVIIPILAWRAFGCPINAAIVIVIAGQAMAFGAIKLWSHTGAALAAERLAQSELRKSAEAANQSRTFLDAILEYVPSILNVRDVETGCTVLANRAMQLTTGKSRAELIGETVLTFMEPGEAALTLARDQAALMSGEPLKLPPYRVITAQGPRILRTTRVPIGGLGHRYILAVSEDVTEEQAISEAEAAAAEALTQALARAEAANEAKSIFLATMSHEIRTPLNGVLGMAQAMAADDLTQTQRERLEIVRQSGQTLLAILNDVLDLSKIEAGKLELESIEFSLSAVAAGCHAAFTNVAFGKGLSFLFEIDDDARGTYLGDPTRLRQILYNLLSNAMKFTQAGEVGVRVSRKDNRLVISVTDTGVGMTPEQAGRLFQKFAQADASTTRKFGGTGLGLAIVRELALAMGGDIEVRSALGEGTTFTVHLDLPWIRTDLEATDAASAKEVERDQTDFGALSVLVAEDNKINQLVIKALLNQIGVDPCVVQDGSLAVDAWEASRWDVILMDVQMPEMDGPTATRLIRSRERETGRARTPILALTANAMTHQVVDYLAAGMDGHVAKPIEALALFSALENILGQAAHDGDDSFDETPAAVLSLN